MWLSAVMTVLVMLGAWQLLFGAWKLQRWIFGTSTTGATSAPTVATRTVAVQGPTTWTGLRGVLTPRFIPLPDNATDVSVERSDISPD